MWEDATRDAATRAQTAQKTAEAQELFRDRVLPIPLCFPSAVIAHVRDRNDKRGESLL
jgi:hypothetical protein